MIFPLDDSSPSPSPSGITQAAVDNALNVASLVFATLVGAAIGFFVALVIAIIVRPIARRSRYFAAIVKRVRTSFYLTALSWGAWIGLQVMLVNTTLSDWSNGGLVGFASHVLLIVSILTTTWMIYNCAWIFEDATQIRQARDGGVSRKFETQAQIIRRLLQVLIIIVGVCFALFTFDAAFSRIIKDDLDVAVRIPGTTANECARRRLHVEVEGHDRLSGLSRNLVLEVLAGVNLRAGRPLHLETNGRSDSETGLRGAVLIGQLRVTDRHFGRDIGCGRGAACCNRGGGMIRKNLNSPDTTNR